MKVLTLVIAFLSLQSLAQEKRLCECYKVITGKFFTVSEDGNDTVHITRTKTSQIESYKRGKSTEKLRLTVIWLDECTYILRDNRPGASLKKKPQKGDIIAEIIETQKDFYVAQARLKGNKKMTVKIYHQ